MHFRPIIISDKEKASKLFEACLADLIIREGISVPGLFTEEVTRLNDAVGASLEKRTPKVYIAERNGVLLGTIALMPPGPLAETHAGADCSDIEFGCVYVDPAFQRKGVGEFLFHSAKEQAKTAAAERFFLDAGFSSSRAYWTKILGEPSVTLQDYWGAGKPHALWVRNFE